RWLDWAAWGPCFAVLCLIEPPPPWLVRALGGFALLLVAWAALMVVLLRRARPDSTGWLQRNVEKLRRGLEPLRRVRTWLMAVFVAPLPWLWETVVLIWLARAFGMELNAIQSFAVLMSFNLAMVVPSPGSFGTVEAGGTAAMALFGFDQSRSIGFLVVYHFTQLLPVLVVCGTLLAA